MKNPSAPVAFLTSLIKVGGALCIAAFAYAPLSLSAAPLTLEIKDTGGVTRNISEIDVAGDVQFNMLDQSGLPANGSEITLTNESSGEILRAVSANGVVTFPGVAPGVWVVASTNANITFTAVNVIASSAIAGTFGGTTVLGLSIPSAVAAGVAGSAAIAGGVIAISHAQDDDGDSPVLSPFQ